MNCSNSSGKTRLAEAQARALADWWGGRYRQVISPECPGKVCYGVIIEPDGAQDLAIPPSCPRAIFSLEEAKILEQVRGPENEGRVGLGRLIALTTGLEGRPLPGKFSPCITSIQFSY